MNRTIVFGTILLGLLLSALDQTIVSSALPTIVKDLGGSGHLSWIVTSYLLAETIAAVIAGKFGDLFGRKRVFQISVVVFIVGSFFCGLAGSMPVLIAARAVQGVGAGGLVVTASALIGEVIPLRDRGRYQGALGAVFGGTTVVGPLLGGVFTEHLSWRWAFYVNVPLAIVVVVLAARTIPAVATAARPKIDYLGVLFIALGAGGAMLALSWDKGQPALLVASIVAFVVFVVVEFRAAEPVLPMRLFGSRVFSVASGLSFVAGFTMLGALTFLPSYLQYVAGASPTMSGIRTLPLVVGLLLASIASGQIVGSTGIYKPFPIVGAVVTGLELFLLSRMDEHTSLVVQSVSIFVLGVGIGLGMQVLTIVVQNTVEFRDLGAATSGVTFFRTLGGAFGASIMGTIFASHLGPPSVHAYAVSLHAVFLWSVPVAVVGLVLALALPQVRMRGAARESVRGAGEGFGMPVGPDADAHLEVLVSRALRRNHDAVTGGLDRATAWGVIAVNVREAALGTPARQADVEHRIHVPPGVLTTYFDSLVDAGYLTRAGDRLDLTERGSLAVTAVVDAWTAWLGEQLSRDDEQVRAALRRIARRVVVNDGEPLARPS